MQVVRKLSWAERKWSQMRRMTAGSVVKVKIFISAAHGARSGAILTGRTDFRALMSLGLADGRARLDVFPGAANSRTELR